MNQYSTFLIWPKLVDFIIPWRKTTLNFSENFEIFAISSSKPNLKRLRPDSHHIGGVDLHNVRERLSGLMNPLDANNTLRSWWQTQMFQQVLDFITVWNARDETSNEQNSYEFIRIFHLKFHLLRFPLYSSLLIVIKWAIYEIKMLLESRVIGHFYILLVCYWPDSITYTSKLRESQITISRGSLKVKLCKHTQYLVMQAP